MAVRFLHCLNPLMISSKEGAFGSEQESFEIPLRVRIFSLKN